MSLATRVTLWHLKRQARRTYLQIDHMWETYDCGRSLMNHISGGRLDRLETKFKELVEQIKVLDPEAFE